MNLVVHLQKKAIRKYGYEMATRQAWKCGIKANLVKRVIGLLKDKLFVWLKAVAQSFLLLLITPFTKMTSKGDMCLLAVYAGNQTTLLLLVFLTLCLCTCVT